ncbi:hypothetical protein WJX73_005906 [Symbiochloris irregularis]|uniref:Prefoldin subunit 6 n=1 Tax=Symbiochloris irregularis TaxID=706552 RepID=A0AAW1PLD2_9CHLO
MSEQLKNLKATLQLEVEAYQTLEKDIKAQQRARQQFLQQKQENDMVMKELALLDDDANVFKLVGPALIKQDPVEAKSNVQKRLEFINGELARLEGQLKGSEEKQLKKQQQIMKIQQDAERLQQASMAPIPVAN